jgi:hypothetical protein
MHTPRRADSADYLGTQVPVLALHIPEQQGEAPMVQAWPVAGQSGKIDDVAAQLLKKQM